MTFEELDVNAKQSRFDGFSYKNYEPGLCERILLAYMQTASGEAAYLQGDFPMSLAQFWRVLWAARDKGLIELRRQGAQSTKRARAREIAKRYPLSAGYSREEQARMADVGEATIYRAAPDKRARAKKSNDLG